MAVRIRPTAADLAIARTVARHARPVPEKISSIVTWGGDEHILTALAAGWWIWCRGKTPDLQVASNHVLLSTVAAVLLPHLLKTQFDQVRPDRRTVRGHLRGAPLSGKALDAFPSGHSVHIGALASAATQLPPSQRNLIWAAGAALVSTRILLLAHWTSDVVAGLAMGATLERGLRFVTGFGRRPPNIAD